MDRRCCGGRAQRSIRRLCRMNSTSGWISWAIYKVTLRYFVPHCRSNHCVLRESAGCAPRCARPKQLITSRRIPLSSLTLLAIVSTGYELFDATQISEYGYGRPQRDFFLRWSVSAVGHPGPSCEAVGGQGEARLKGCRSSSPGR
jgi:hypothetical protein